MIGCDTECRVASLPERKCITLGIRVTMEVVTGEFTVLQKGSIGLLGVSQDASFCILCIFTK